VISSSRRKTLRRLRAEIAVDKEAAPAPEFLVETESVPGAEILFAGPSFSLR
jgi:hypothetical protein